VHDRYGLSEATRGLGALALRAGDPEEAQRLLLESAQISDTLGDRLGAARTKELTARVALARGDRAEARRALEEVAATRIALGAPVLPHERSSWDAFVAEIGGRDPLGGQAGPLASV
jgi:hypothetical protein